MRKLTLSEWKKKYAVDSIERFDQKNHMFSRVAWDDEVKNILSDWSFSSEPKNI